MQLKDIPDFNLWDPHWPILNALDGHPPSKIPDYNGSYMLTSPGNIIGRGAYVEHSVLGPQVEICTGASVINSILLNNVHVGEGTHVENAIIDKRVRIPARTHINGSELSDQNKPEGTTVEDGIVVFPKRYRF